MDINVIAGKVKENIRGDKLILGDGTTGIPHIMALFYGYTDGKDLELGEVAYSFENGILRVGGSGYFPGGVSRPVEMVFWNDENGVLQVEMPEQYLLQAFPPKQLSCRCAYGQEAWLISFAQQGVLSMADMLVGGISYLGISVPASCFGKTGDISNLCFGFEFPFEETGTENDTFVNYNREKYFSLYFETNLRLNLSGIFEAGEQVGLGIRSFQVEKFGALYGFSFAGDLKIWEFDLPFTIRYDSGSLTLATVKDEKSTLAVPSINDLGKIIGLNDLHLPESFSSLSNFECETISLSVSEDFSRLLSFSVVVSNKNVWQIARTPDIHITNLTAGFTKDCAGNEIFISGQLDLAGWALTLAAAYHTQDGWVFRCFIGAEGEKLSLSSLFDRLCDFLGFGRVPFPLPDQETVGAMVSYSLQTKEFSAHMEIGKLTGEFSYFFAPSKSYRLCLNAGYELALSMLPVVGEDLHLLDRVTVRDIRLEAGGESTVLYLDFSGEKLRLDLAGGKKEEAAGKLPGQYPVSAEPAGAVKILWFRLEKHFSVFAIHRIGLGFDGKKITFAFDAELMAGAFRLALSGLSISAQMAERPEISFDLAGMSIGFKSPAFSIDGGFRHTVCGDVSSYDGSLIVKAKGISVFVTGSYSKGSFLAYGILRARIGGPPAFSITGLAVGFGIHKYLTLPSIEQVEEYPLVTAAVREDFSPEQLLDGLKAKTETLAGQNFLAAGVRFHSFGMAHSFALLTVSFGQRTEIALLGICEMTAPPMEEKGTQVKPLAKARLALKAALLPESGMFSAQAQLMPDSYILSEKCRLTGGFACCVWFAGEHRDDFVVTLGGYRKGYRRPAHYPDVPRVGFRWDVTKELTMSGEMYFALTPSMLCAGGRLDAVFVMGALRAWFTAYADFEMGWKPFNYDIRVGISLGASITLDMWLFSKTFTLEMAVDLHLWGPEFHGRARITWWVISFTISFGKGEEEEKTIDWNRFKDSFLRDSAKHSGGGQMGNAETGGVVSIHAAQGVVGTASEQRAAGAAAAQDDIGTAAEQGGEIEVLSADAVRIDIESLIPGAVFRLNGVELSTEKAASAAEDVPKGIREENAAESIPVENTKQSTGEKAGSGDCPASVSGESAIGVYPMGENVTLASTVDISLRTSGGKGRISCQTEEIRRNVPKALWARQKEKLGAGEEAEEMIKNVPVGTSVTILPKEFAMFPEKRFLTLDMLSEYEKIEKKFGFTSESHFEIEGRDTDFGAFRETAGSIPGKAGAFAQEMEAFGFHFDFQPDLKIMAEHAADLFDEEFLLGRPESRSAVKGNEL